MAGSHHLNANHSVVQDVCYKNAKSEKNHLNVIHQLKGEFFSQFRNSGVTFTVKSAGARIKQVLSTSLDDSHPNKPTTKKEENKTKQKNLLEIGMIFEEHLLFF